MEKLELWQLRQRQGLPLEIKEQYTARRIKNWYEHFNGKVYVAFSGGKDSTVLLHQVRKLFPEVPAVFSDTGMEYPEIREFVKSIDNTVVVRPKITFNKVIEIYGYPVISKKVSRSIRDLQKETKRNVNVCNLYRTGYTQDGNYCPSRKLAKKWFILVNAPFKCSEQCCDVIKKQPMKEYEKKTGQSPFLGTMADDSKMREKSYLASGCNVYNLKENISTPMGFWREDDVWAYISKHNIPYSGIYDMGEKRTGCMFCMFGIHLEKGENRFQRMLKSHPKQYYYCIYSLGLGKVLDYIGVPY